MIGEIRWQDAANREVLISLESANARDATFAGARTVGKSLHASLHFTLHSGGLVGPP